MSRAPNPRVARRGFRLDVAAGATAGAPALALALALATAACAKDKPKAEDTPAAVVASQGVPSGSPGGFPAALLCLDNIHRRGDHWRVACNVCRCGADGDILCSQHTCAEGAASSDAGPPSRDAARRD